jgi:hypothetical protein
MERRMVAGVVHEDNFTLHCQTDKIEWRLRREESGDPEYYSWSITLWALDENQEATQCLENYGAMHHFQVLNKFCELAKIDGVPYSNGSVSRNYKNYENRTIYLASGGGGLMCRLDDKMVSLTHYCYESDDHGEGWVIVVSDLSNYHWQNHDAVEILDSYEFENSNEGLESALIEFWDVVQTMRFEEHATSV